MEALNDYSGELDPAFVVGEGGSGSLRIWTCLCNKLNIINGLFKKFWHETLKKDLRWGCSFWRNYYYCYWKKRGFWKFSLVDEKSTLIGKKILWDFLLEVLNKNLFNEFSDIRTLVNLLLQTISKWHSWNLRPVGKLVLHRSRNQWP